MSHSETVVRLGEFFVRFTPAGGGFPSGGFLDGGREELILATDRPWLSVDLPDGQTAVPFWPENAPPQVWTGPDATRVEFQNLPWRSSDGRLLEDFRLTLRYEFWPDGAAFVRAFFTVQGTQQPDLAHLRLCPPVSIPAGHEVSWSSWDSPNLSCASLIQALGGVQRFQNAGTDLDREGALLPYVGFDFGAEGRRDHHLEFFLEGSNSPGAEQDNIRTTLRWSGNSPQLDWDFLRERRRSPNRPWRWRNQFGWTLCRAPRRRRHAPLKMYHYIDGERPYPTDRQIEKMAAEGADLLVLHEQWRADPQDGGTPCRPDDFHRMVQKVREQGLRLALYIRGNEPSVREEGAGWFDQLLRRDVDGLYMDFGTPICYSTALDESYPRGRIAFREYYLAIRKLRERVGERGILLSHSGPFFAACGMTGLVDGYVAGEGERGVLLSDPTAHAYFSGVSVAPPTMWTAAFPDYRTRRALPWLASVGQMPHVALGTQIQSSSLQHPMEPGSVTFARPLWKLWGLLQGQQDLLTLHLQNTHGVFATDSADTAACLFGCADGSLLLIAANLSETGRKIDIRVDWGAAGIAPGQGATAWQLDPLSDPPAARRVAMPDTFTLELPGHGVAGWLLSAQPEAWQALLARFTEPYCRADEADEQYQREIESLRGHRFAPAPRSQLFMRLAIPAYPIPYEDSIWWDLFDSCNPLVRRLPDGRDEQLGYLTRKGLVPTKPGVGDQLYPGVCTPWVPLHEILPPGQHNLAIMTLHQGEPFYSFVTAQFSSDPGTMAEPCEIRFANELDADRSRLTFAVDLRSQREASTR